MLIKNRFGRLVDVSSEQAEYMIRNGEAELANETPAKKEEHIRKPSECPYCGRDCRTVLALSKHSAKCEKKN